MNTSDVVCAHRTGVALHDRKYSCLLHTLGQNSKDRLLRLREVRDVIFRTVVVNPNQDTIGDERGIFELGSPDSDSKRSSKVESPSECKLKDAQHALIGDGDIHCVRLGSVDQISHNTSLTGHGAHCACAPMATTEAATSVVGDIVRDGTDETPGRHRSPVEKSDATGAAAPSRRPHPKPSTESGSVQR